MSGEEIAFCTLGEREFGGREAAWHAVFRESIRECRDLEDGFQFWLAANPGVFLELERLAALENRCCRWMRIDVQGGDPVSLRITSAAIGGKDIIRLLIPETMKIAGYVNENRT